MAQYIDKSALVAEIEKRRKEWWFGSSIEAKYKKEECDDILFFINTLEVKEVDINKEIGCFFNDECWKDGVLKAEQQDTIEFAKHFFKLGLKAQKGE